MIFKGEGGERKSERGERQVGVNVVRNHESELCSDCTLFRQHCMADLQEETGAKRGRDVV